MQTRLNMAKIKLVPEVDCCEYRDVLWEGIFPLKFSIDCLSKVAGGGSVGKFYCSGNICRGPLNETLTLSIKIFSTVIQCFVGNTVLQMI